MFSHLIIGKGNVGVDLYHAIKKAGHTARILTRSDGFEFPESLPQIHHFKPDFIWVAAGAGSIEAAKANFQLTLETHVLLPEGLMKEMRPECKLIFFSSDYAADEENPSDPTKCNKNPKSLYSLSKVILEHTVRIVNRPNTCVVRVGSIYGSWFYEKTFPGKLNARYPSPCQIELSMNRVTPTPSKWVADMLVKNLDKIFDPTKPTLHHIAPSGSISVQMWGQRILGEGYKVTSRGFDQDRPLCSNLGCSLDPQPPDWTDLWSSDWYSKPPAPDLLD